MSSGKTLTHTMRGNLEVRREEGRLKVEKMLVHVAGTQVATKSELK
jgi:hypothetical protein